MKIKSHNNKLIAVGWKILACACFSVINGIVRYLSMDNVGIEGIFIKPLPATVIAFFQNFFGLLFALPWILKKDIWHVNNKVGRGYKKIKNVKLLHFIRVIAAVIGVLFLHLSFKNLQIIYVIALGFTGPIFTIIGAIVFLQEKLTIQRATAISLSVFGGYLIMRPDRIFFTTFDYAMFFPMISAIFFVITKLTSRILAASGEPAEKLAAYLLLFIAPATFLLAIFNWQMPTLKQFYYLLILGIFVKTAYFSINKAYEYTDVTFLMPFGSVKIILSALVSYLAFAELPETMELWIGVIIVFLSTMLLSYENKNLNINKMNSHRYNY